MYEISHKLFCPSKFLLIFFFHSFQLLRQLDDVIIKPRFNSTSLLDDYKIVTIISLSKEKKLKKNK